MITLMVRTSTGSHPIHLDEAPIIAKYGCNNRHSVDLIASYIALLDDSPLQNGSYKPLRLFVSFLRELTNDLRGTIATFANLYDEIVVSTTIMGGASITGRFIDAMKDTPVFKEYLEWYRTGDPHLLTYLGTFLLFLKKATWHDDSLQTTALRRWNENELRLNDLVLPDVNRLRSVVHYLLADFEFSGIYGKFGPGAVSEAYVGIFEKADNFRIPPKIAYAFHTSSCGRRIDCKTVPSGSIDAQEDSWFSRRKFVPKNYKTMRTIHIEPNSAMYYQQMLALDLHEHFHRVLLRFINLKDQRFNRFYSQWGSETGMYDTIDLSDASDLMSLELVKAIFPRRLLYYLLATRSGIVKDGEEVVKIKKFAPMGSALCFPIQCIVFLAVVLESYYEQRYGGTGGDKIDPKRMEKLIYGMQFPNDNPMYDGALMNPLVYGDDIIADSRVGESVIHKLESYGFRVNTQKSYTGSCAFRESCGGYHWNGFDVTPLMYRGDNMEESSPITRMASQVDFSNDLLQWGYYRSRRYRINHMRVDPELKHFPLAFTNRDVPLGLRTLGIPYNPHLKVRVGKPLTSAELSATVIRDGKSVPRRYGSHRELQRSEWRIVQPEAHTRNSPLSYNVERYGYSSWWRTVRQEEEITTFKSSFSRRSFVKSRWQWRWIPLLD